MYHLGRLLGGGDFLTLPLREWEGLPLRDRDLTNTTSAR